MEEKIFEEEPIVKEKPKNVLQGMKLAGKYDDLPKPLQKGKYLFIYSLIIIPLLGWFVFYFCVAVQSIALAFQQPVINADGSEGYYWTLRQFEKIVEQLRMSNTSELPTAFRNTFLYFAESVFIELPLSILLAYYFARKLGGGKFFRVLIFIPGMLSGVAVTTMFKNFIASDGPISTMLFDLFDYQMPSLLTERETATPTIIFYTFFFSMTNNLLLLQGAFMRVGGEVSDAAKLDGCGELRELILIDIPMIWSTLSTLILLNFTGIFSASGPIFLFTQGAAGTTTISWWIYDLTMNSTDYNLPSALGLCLTTISLPIVFIVFKLLFPKENLEY